LLNLFRTIPKWLVTERVNDVLENPRLPEKFFWLPQEAPSGTKWNGAAKRNDGDQYSCVLMLDEGDLVGSILLVTSDSKTATSASRIRMICLEAIATIFGKHAVKKTSPMSCNSPGLLLDGSD
jgi:hypothetical protein